MDSTSRACRGCGKLCFEWVERDKCGWCILCGYFEYFPSFSKFMENTEGDDAPLA